MNKKRSRGKILQPKGDREIAPRLLESKTNLGHMLKDQREGGKAVTRRDRQEETAYSANHTSYPAPHRMGK